MDMIDGALKMAGLALSQIDGYAFTVGPGSFTGLRIGLSVVKGLAVIGEKPMVGVSSLEVLALQTPDRSLLVCPMMDARNNEVYCARFRLADGALLTVNNEAAMTPAASVADIDEPCMLMGDGALRYRTLIEEHVGKYARFASPAHGIPRAYSVAQLSLSRFQTGQTDDVRNIVPVYLRKSYAEQKRTG
jgi:tRNA threonylcarbamoyladenosine biosynthesis protein TsaB